MRIGGRGDADNASKGVGRRPSRVRYRSTLSAIRRRSSTRRSSNRRLRRECACGRIRKCLVDELEQQLTQAERADVNGKRDLRKASERSTLDETAKLGAGDRVLATLIAPHHHTRSPLPSARTGAWLSAARSCAYSVIGRRVRDDDRHLGTEQHGSVVVTSGPSQQDLGARLDSLLGPRGSRVS